MNYSPFFESQNYDVQERALPVKTTYRFSVTDKDGVSSVIDICDENIARALIQLYFIIDYHEWGIEPEPKVEYHTIFSFDDYRKHGDLYCPIKAVSEEGKREFIADYIDKEYLQRHEGEFDTENLDRVCEMIVMSTDAGMDNIKSIRSLIKADLDQRRAIKAMRT